MQGRAHTDAPPAAPPFKPPARHKPSKTGTALESFQDLAQHRSGLFRKKVTIANMLSWTRVSINHHYDVWS